MSYSATYFLSGESKIHTVEVELTSLTLIIRENNITINSYDIKKCKFSTIIAGIPIEVALPDRGRLEIENTSEIIKDIHNLKILKHYSPYYLENKLKYFVVGLILTIGIFFASFKYVIPAMSRKLSLYTPDRIALFLDDRIKSQLDQFIFSESEIDPKVKTKLVNYFNENGLQDIHINFRKGNSAQANAFALAGKNIFFTDEIIELMNNDKYLLAIAYHEAGHLKHRHVVSTIIKDSLVLVLTMVYLGDLPGAADNVMQIGLVLYSHDHSRVFEKEADDYAIKELVKNNISPKCFTEGMDKLHAHYKNKSILKKEKESKSKNKDIDNKTENEKEVSKNEDKKKKEETFVEKYKVEDKLKTVENVLTKYLSTHPSLKERTTDILKNYPDAKDCDGSKIIAESTNE